MGNAEQFSSRLTPNLNSEKNEKDPAHVPQWVSLAEFNDMDPQRFFFATSMLPIGVDPSKIELHYERMVNLCDFSGIATLKITGDHIYNDPVEAQVDDINPDGSTSMKGIMTRTKVSESDGSHSNDDYDNENSIRSVDGKIRIDIQKLLRRTAGVHSTLTHQISRGLDQEIRTNIAQLGARNMLGMDKNSKDENARKISLLGYVISATTTISYVTTMLEYENNRDLKVAVWPILLIAISNAYHFESNLKKNRSNPNRKPQAKRYSFLIEHAIDRAAILYMDCYLNRGLVRESKSDKSKK